MELKNPLYKNQGIHVVSSIFTVDKGICKVLLIQRKNEPFKGKWALVGGALYNNETLEEGMLREIKEKTNISDIQLIPSKNYSKVDRSPVMRMIGISYIGIIDIKKANLITKTLKTENAMWFSIDDIPELAYDYNEILKDAIDLLKTRIVSSDILRNLYPDGFTLPEIQKVYEAILDRELDRRNFRKKMLSLGLIIDTNKTARFEGNKPAKLYKFNGKAMDKNVF
ncbi:MAG: NUDIX hydrolase [Firmicutes bacterium]|nr:NUDIX hydrolase [Bacillota bacterium]